MKNIVVAGPAYSGKGSLCRMLALEYGLSHIPFDALMHALGAEPDAAFTFLKNSILALEEEGVGYVCETSRLHPLQVGELLSTDSRAPTIIFVGYPGCSLEQKLSGKSLARKNRSAALDKEHLRDHLAQCIVESKVFASECAKLRLPFFDTSNRFDATLQNIVDYLAERMQAA